MSLPRRRGPPEEDPNLPPEEEFPQHAVYGLPPGPPLPMEAGIGYDPNAAARMGRGYMDTRGPPLPYYPRGPPMGSPYMSGGYALGPPGLEGYAPLRGMAPLVMGPDELTLISPQAAMLARQQAGMRGPRPGPIGSGRPSAIDQLSGAVEDLTLGVPEAAYPHALALVPPPLPLSTRALRFPRRPGMGTLGRPVKVKANHFLLEILPRVDLFQYDVSVPSIMDPHMGMRLWLCLVLRETLTCLQPMLLNKSGQGFVELSSRASRGLPCCVLSLHAEAG
jgi:hypothetical protein